MVLYSAVHCTVSRTIAATPDAMMHLSINIKKSRRQTQVLGAKKTLFVGFSRKKESKLLCSFRHFQRKYNFIPKTAIKSI